MLSIQERNQAPIAQWKSSIQQAIYDIRVCLPGIIQSFNATEQTVTVQLAIRERVVLTDPDTLESSFTTKEIPILPDVPIILPRAGGCTLTLPIKEGDECLVMFADMCINSWWASGGTQNQEVKRRHDLSDGFAILGTWSQPRVLSGYAASTAQLRNDDGDTYVELDPTGKIINIHAPNGVNIDGDVSVTGTVTASGEGTFNGGHTVSNHVHGGVTTGSSDTQKPTG